ncbi:replication protein [Nocardia salmonicida]|uniref:replication protein n=1 Tax=Nocardia salmonicida TaxID=53431 RepID=UPI003794173F
MTNHWSEDNARPKVDSTESRRVPSPATPTSAAVMCIDRPQQGEVDKWQALIEAAITDRYRGSSPQKRRRGHIKCPPTIRRGHVCGHQCTSLPPRLVAMWGGNEAACRRVCRVRLDPRNDSHDTGVGAVACWFDRESYTKAADATFDRQYRTVRPILIKRRGGTTGGGVAKRAFMRVVEVMAAAADRETGRGCFLSNATIAERSGLSTTTVGRVRLAMLLMGVATEVMRGRQRTRVERMASWRVGDKARGWASVWSLHPPRNVGSVDRGGDEVRPGQTNMATHPFRGRVFVSSESSSSSYVSKSCGKRSASRRIDKRGQREAKPRPPQKALVLALRWLGDARTPVWARRYTADAWAHVLAPAAEHGWTPDDLNDSLHPAAAPRWPLAYVRAMLVAVDLPYPPHVLRSIAEQQAAQAQAALDHAVDEIVSTAKAEAAVKRVAVREAALAGDGRRSALAEARAAAEAAAQRRDAGEKFDHQGHWRRLRDERRGRS